MAEIRQVRGGKIPKELSGFFKESDTVRVEDAEGIVVGLDAMLGNGDLTKARVQAV